MPYSGFVADNAWLWFITVLCVGGIFLRTWILARLKPSPRTVDLDRSVKKKAAEKGVTVVQNVEYTADRFLFEYGMHYANGGANVPSLATAQDKIKALLRCKCRATYPKLRTILPNGTEEDTTRDLEPGNRTKGLFTYTRPQAMSKDRRHDWMKPFVGEEPDFSGRFPVVQTWRVNCTKKFKECFDIQDVTVEKLNGDAGFKKAYDEFRRVLAALFTDDLKANIKHAKKKHKESYDEIFIGNVRDLMDWLRFDDVQEYLRLESVDKHKPRFKAHYITPSGYKRAWGSKYWDFGTYEEELYVVFTRKATGQFTCIKPLAAYKADIGDVYRMEDFEKVKFLSGGTYGEVYTVKHTNTLTRFALKEFTSRAMKLGTDENAVGDAVGRIKASREYQILEEIMGFPHPCLVKVIHLHMPCPTSVYPNGAIIMELCDSSLYDKIQLFKGVSGYQIPVHAEKWIWEVYRGLRFLHSRRVTHRDIKPQNILLAGDVAKVTDFGSSKLGVTDGNNSWDPHTPKGTPGWDAPEVVQNLVDTRQTIYGSAADLYQLGLVIWCLLSGDGPHPDLKGAKFGQWEIIAPALKDEHQRYKTGVESYTNLPSKYQPMRELALALLSEEPKERPKHASMPAKFNFQLPTNEIYGDTVETAQVDVTDPSW